MVCIGVMISMLGPMEEGDVAADVAQQITDGVTTNGSGPPEEGSSAILKKEQAQKVCTLRFGISIMLGIRFFHQLTRASVVSGNKDCRLSTS